MKVSGGGVPGASILAGTATGRHKSARKASLDISKIERTYQPDARKAKSTRAVRAYRELIRR
jgi:hypothetical protein